MAAPLFWNFLATVCMKMRCLWLVLRYSAWKHVATSKNGFKQLGIPSYTCGITLRINRSLTYRTKLPHSPASSLNTFSQVLLAFFHAVHAVIRCYLSLEPVSPVATCCYVSRGHPLKALWLHDAWRSWHSLCTWARILVSCMDLPAPRKALPKDFY